jgi:hypothetical protein
VKRREDRWLVTKAAEVLRTQLAHLIGPGHVSLKLTGVGLVAMITFFAVVQADYRVGAKTFIEAQTQRVAVAPFDGYIAEARVRAGDLVLSAFPTDPLPFKVEKITPVSIAQEGRNYFRVEAQLDHKLEHLRLGMEGVGKSGMSSTRSVMMFWISFIHRA